MTVHQFDGGLSAALAAMRERIHQELSLGAVRHGPVLIRIRLAAALLENTPAVTWQQELAQMEAYLRTLPELDAHIEHHPRARRHQLHIEQAAGQAVTTKGLEKWRQGLSNALAIFLDKVTVDMEGAPEAEMPRPPVTPGAADGRGVGSGLPVTGGHSLPLMHAALEALAIYLLEHVRHINQYDNQRLILNRVYFLARNDAARQEFEAFFQGRDTPRTWRGVLQDYIRQQNGQKVPPALDLDQLQAFALLAPGSEGDLDSPQVITGKNSTPLAYLVKLAWSYDTMPADAETTPPASVAVSKGILRLEIRDALSPVLSRLVDAPSMDFVIGRTGDIVVEGGSTCSGEHLRFVYRDQRWHAIDISRNGTLYSGVPMPHNSPQPLRAGDVFRFDALSPGNPAGDYANRPEIRVAVLLTQVITQPVEPLQPSHVVTELPLVGAVKPSQIATVIDLPAAPQARLSVLTEAGWRELLFTGPNVLVGRSEKCQVVIDSTRHGAVSRQHLCIESIEEDHVRVSICPECSTGVYLNGKPLPRDTASRVDYEQELCLAPPEQAGHARVRFLKGGA